MDEEKPTFIDINGIKKRDRKLLMQSESIKVSPHGVLLLEKNPTDQYTVISTNPYFEKLTGYTEGELVDQTLDILVGQGTDEDSQNKINEALKNEEPYQGFIVHYTKFEKPFHSRFSLTPIKHENSDEVMGYVYITEDYTRYFEAEKSIKLKSKQLALSNYDLENLAYSISHDFSEPVRAIDSYIDLISESIESGENTDLLAFSKFIKQGSADLKNKISCLLDYTRIHSRGKIFSTHSLEDSYLEAYEELMPEMQAKFSTITSTISEFPTVLGDRDQLTIMWKHLLQNALTHAGEQGVNITVTMKNKGDVYQFAVEDDGKGIPSTERKNLFVLLNKIDPEQSVKASARGLPLSRRIALRHGGDMWIESEEGEGTTVFFTLPLA